MECFLENYDLIDIRSGKVIIEQPIDWPNFILEYHAHLQAALFLYKREAEAQSLPGIHACTAKKLYSELKLAFSACDRWGKYHISTYRAEHTPSTSDSLAWNPNYLEAWKVQKATEPYSNDGSAYICKITNFIYLIQNLANILIDKISVNLFKAGTTYGNEKYVYFRNIYLHESSADWLLDARMSDSELATINKRRLEIGEVFFPH